jgi:prefoldin subunit 5
VDESTLERVLEVLLDVIEEQKGEIMRLRVVKADLERAKRTIESMERSRKVAS